jgi:hypothetical protein
VFGGAIAKMAGTVSRGMLWEHGNGQKAHAIRFAGEQLSV